MTVLKQSSDPSSNVKGMVLRVQFIEKSDSIFNKQTLKKNFPIEKQTKKPGKETFRAMPTGTSLAVQ